MFKRRLLPFSQPPSHTPSLWEGPAPLCLAEHYDGKVRRLRLVLTKQGCLSQGEQNQFLNHTHPLHGSGLLFGYAADGFANPDWLIVSDTSHPGAWRLLHAVSKAGGSRFTVGSAVRYPPGKSDVANKARLYQFEALHKIYFYDAWRNEPILNRENSSLLLPPAPGMLQEGCYWRPAAATSADTQPLATGKPDGSLAPDDLDLISSDGQPSLLPSPDSTHRVNDSSSECSQGHHEPGEGVCSQSATSPPSASPRSQADEQQDAPPAEGTGAARVMTEPADITACPSGLSRHRTNIQDNNKMAEGDCPSSCPPAEQAETGAPGAHALKGMRRRWQQASLARTGEPSDRGEPSETDASQQRFEGKGRPPPLRRVKGPFRPRPPNTVRLSPRRPNRWQCCSALQRVSKTHQNMAQKTQANRGSSHRTRIPEKRTQTSKSALLRLPWERKGTMLGVLAGTPRLNVQSGHSKALNQGSSCAAWSQPCKGEDIR